MKVENKINDCPELFFVKYPKTSFLFFGIPALAFLSFVANDARKVKENEEEKKANDSIKYLRGLTTFGTEQSFQCYIEDPNSDYVLVTGTSKEKQEHHYTDSYVFLEVYFPVLFFNQMVDEVLSTSPSLLSYVWDREWAIGPISGSPIHKWQNFYEFSTEGSKSQLHKNPRLTKHLAEWVNDSIFNCLTIEQHADKINKNLDND